MRWSFVAAIALIASLGSVTSARAQGTATSSIVGVVVDSADAVVPGATVLVKSDTTGAEYSVVTSAAGDFTVPALNVGTYTVTVTLSGFKTFVLKNVVVTAGGPSNVRAKLELGGLEESVVVQGGSEIVQTTSASVSTTLNTKAIVSLPVATRDSLNFVQFLPGVQTPGTVRNSQVNGLPQSSLNITLDGVSIQDNTNKTTDGFFAIVSPRLDAIEEVTLTSAAQGADSNGQGAAQVRFTTRSGSNTFVGSAYHFYQSDKLNSNTYANNVRGLPKGKEKLNQPGFRQGGPVIIPGLFDGRDKLFFFVNYEETRSPDTITTNSTLLLPDAQRGIFRYNGGPAAGIDLYALAALNGQTSTPDPTIARLLQDIRTAAGTPGTLSPLTGNLNAERFSFQQRDDSIVHYPTVRIDYNIARNHRATGTWYRQVFADSVDTTNTRQNTWPGFPVYGVQGSLRKATTGSLRSTFGSNLVNEARVAYSGAPVYFSNNLTRDLWRGPLANQGGFQLQISAAGITNAGQTGTPSSRDAYTWTVTDTVTWIKDRHNISLGGEYSKYDVWLATTGSLVPPSISFGTQTGDPALAMFNATNFPGSSATDRTNAANLYAVLTGRVTAITSTARLDPSTGKYVYQGDSRAQGRLQQSDLFVQDNWRVRQNLTINAGVRYALQLPFYALNSSYSTATMDAVWGISGYLPGCDPSHATPETCNLFKPGLMPGQKTTYQNLGEGVEAYKTDWDNFAPSIGVNWTPSVEQGFWRTVLGRPGDTALSGGFSRAYERHGMDDFTGAFGDNPGLSITATRNTANGNLAVPLLFRSGNLGPPSTCPPAPAVKPTGCLLETAEYPLTNQVSTGTVHIFDPNLQVPFSDTWTVGIQRAIGTKSSIAVRYIGTRNRDQWTEYNYNEANINENGFLTEFRNAQANLEANIASGVSARAGSFAYFGPGTGTVPLPIYLAFFSGTSLGQAGDASKYTSSNFTNQNFVNPLAKYNPDPFTPAGTNSTRGLAGDPQRQANAILAGLPANFFRVNPDVLGGATVTGNGGYSTYNSMQVEFVRRLSDGLQLNANYVLGSGYNSSRYSFRVPRLLTRDSGTEGDVTHAVKAAAVYDLPFGRGRHFVSDAGAVMDRIVGGWQVSGTMRLQSGRLFDLGNMRIVGMTEDEVQKMFKLRFEDPTIIYAWPEDVINETIKAWSVSATSATGYSALGAPSGRYFAPANGPDCIETIASAYGDCGVRTLIVSGPRIQNIDMSLRKQVPIKGRVNFELSVDAFNVFNHVNFTPTTGITNSAFGTTESSYQATLPTTQRVIQIGTRVNW
jgi:carboxypeptidase family protein